jgi:hypothetical protein
MDRSLRWTLVSGAGMLLAGAAGAYAWFSMATFREPAFAGMLFLVIVAASFLGAQAHRRGFRGAALTGAWSGGLGVLGFFGVPFLMWYDEGLDLAALAVIVGIALAFAAACSAGGAYFLARGVDRYRAEHGMAHAPR